MLAIIGGLLLSSCLPLALQTANSGVCKSGDEEVDTYKLVVPEAGTGTSWKLDSLSNTEGSFQVLHIESPSITFNEPPDEEIDGVPVVLNSRFCKVQYENGSFAFPHWVGVYHHDHSSVPKRLGVNFIDLDFDDTEQIEQFITYTFSGNCGDTKLNLTFPDASQETYTIFNTSTVVGTCQPDQPQQ